MNPSAVGVAPLSPIQSVNGILLVVAVTELVKLLVVLYLHRREVSEAKKKPPHTNRVRVLREQHGAMSQADLARAVGVSRQTIIAIEQGHYSPSLERAFRMAHQFGVGIEDVFGWEP